MLELSRRWTGWTSCQASSVRQARQHAWAMGAIVMCLVNIMSMDWWNTINLKPHVASYMRRDLEKTEEKALLQLASYVASHMHGYQLHWALPSHWTSRVEAIAVTSTTGHACSTFIEFGNKPGVIHCSAMSCTAVCISWCKARMQLATACMWVTSKLVVI